VGSANLSERANFQGAAENEERRRSIIYLVPIYVLLFLILLDAFIAPFLESRRLAISQVFYGALKPVCHQWPTHCLWVFGSNTALCCRCLGIFLALFFTGLFYGIRGANQIYWKTAILMNLPALIDGYSQLKGWRTSNNFLRFGTGLLAGVGAGLICFPVYLILVTSIALTFKKKHFQSNSG